MIDQATVQRILNAADIVEVVSDYVHLTRRGANYVGLCPFHNERTPSFSVSPGRGICKCFSCGKGGSPVNFIMEKEGINFHDALLRLAAKYGIKVEERELTDEERARQSRREAMLTVNEWAMHRFAENMRATEDGRNIGLQYFYQRGITDAAIDKFKLGYALDKPTDMYDAAKRQGYDEEALFNVGLCGRSQQGNRPYDRFRGRVIYPMLNTAGKVIAFGGRGIKGEAAKYINSPESEIYHKSSELYGIYQAKNAIVRQKECFLVEGYMDVIGMWQSGMENTVASSGTSLTDGQIALIHRFTDNITIIYDGDSAGIHASLRAIDLCLAQNIEIKLLLLPDGDDPDSFARKNTPEQFRQYVRDHEMNFIQFQAHAYAEQLKSPAGRNEALRAMVTSLAHVTDLIKRTLYIQECSRLMNISEAIITTEVSRITPQISRNMQRRRELNRLGQDPDKAPASTQQASTQTPAAQAHDKPQTAPQQLSLIASVERQVLEYVVKYGMVPLCMLDDNDDKTTWLNVAEYIAEDIKADNIDFSNQFYSRLFRRIIELIPTFRADQADFLNELRNSYADDRRRWVEEMQSRSLSISEIEAEEQRRNDELARAEQAKIHEYACQWIGRRLGSDPDDSTRNFVLDVITPRYTLSKYHSKNMHIETDDERLVDLVPRALTEWKDALLQERRNTLMAKLNEAQADADPDKIIDIMREIQRCDTLRRDAAKTLGERILIPKR